MPFDGHSFDHEDDILRTLIRADAFLDSPDKWYQGDYINEQGDAMCILGALHLGYTGEKPLPVTKSDEDIDHYVSCKITAWLCEEVFIISYYIGLIPKWNDDPDTEFRDIKRVLAEAKEIRADQLAVKKA